MSNYSKTTDFASKDALTTGNANKIVKGTEIDDEFDAIQVAVTTKANLNSPTLTGTPLAPTAAVDTNTTQIATTAFVESAKAAVEAAYLAADAANEAARDLVDMIAGDGITGGGTIDASRTLTLGTPGTVTSTSTNAVTATSHTHAIDEAYLDGEFTGSGVQDVDGSEGYQVFPGGLIVQWGTEVLSGAGSTVTVTLPKALTTKIFLAFGQAATALPVNQDNSSNSAGLNGSSLTSIKVTTDANGGSTTWFVVGY
jgi:hypothetical protein